MTKLFDLSETFQNFDEYNLSKFGYEKILDIYNENFDLIDELNDN